MILRSFAAALAVGLAAGAVSAETVVLDSQARFPEGPLVVESRLYYAEYGGDQVTVWDGGEPGAFWEQAGCGPSAVLQIAAGDFLVTCYDSGTIARVSSSGETLANYDSDSAGGGLLGPNDLTADGKGGAFFTASGPWESEPIVGKVYHISPEGQITLLADHLHYANGLALSHDGSLLYVAESEAARVITFAVGADGSLSDRRLFVRLSDLELGHAWGPYPDGMKLDAAGNLWIGHYSAPQVVIVSSEGQLLGSFDVPSEAAPNLAFSEDEATVYVMAVDDTEEAPYLGKVYAVANPLGQ